MHKLLFPLILLFSTLFLSCRAEVSFSDILQGSSLSIRAVELVSPPGTVEYVLLDNGTLKTRLGEEVSELNLAGLSVSAKTQDGTTTRVSSVSVPKVSDLHLKPGVNVIPVSVQDFSNSELSFSIFCFFADGLISPLAVSYTNEDENFISSLPAPLKNDYAIARTEVSYAEWKEVYDWAVQNGYAFNDEGSAEDKDFPVTEISLRDARVWCNAKSEKAYLSPVYRAKSDSNTILRDSRDGSQIDAATITSENGYRLPTREEFTFAAKGGICAYYASVMKTKPSSDFADETMWTFAWSGTNSEQDLKLYAVFDSLSSEPCGAKYPNSLRLYDMSGNIAEWCDDRDSNGNYYILGGSFYDEAALCKIEDKSHSLPAAAVSDSVGFRLCRSLLAAP